MLIMEKIQSKEEIKNIWGIKIEEEGRKRKSIRKQKGKALKKENIEAM